jgi:hypothetical protein
VVVLEDIDKLEDVLQALWTGTVNTRHAVYLSSRAGLTQVATFRTVGLLPGKSGPSIRYVTRLYRTTTVMAIDNQDTFTSVATLDQLYYLHPGHGLTTPVTEMEVRGTKLQCPTCAIVVHIHDYQYLTVHPGHLSCQLAGGRVHYNLTGGQLITLTSLDSCNNDAMYLGRSILRLQELTIDSTNDQSMDALLTRKTTEPDIVMETMAIMKATHAAVNLKLHHAVASAQEDIATFVQDTSQQLGGFTITTGISLGGLALVAIVLLSIVSCILCRCVAARKSVNAVAAPISV